MRIRRRFGFCALSLTLLAGAAACGDDGRPGTPAASEPAPVTTPSTTSTTRALTPEEEVEAAYLRSWHVYAKAVRELDPSGLEEVYAGRALEVVRDEIEELKAKGQAVGGGVEHNIVHIQLVEPAGAIVQDEYVNHMVLVDAQSGRALEPDPNEKLFETYQFREIDGTWKVVAIVRESL